jgi:uncharacterized membrane protein YoaK (UPF0700 family)
MATSNFRYTIEGLFAAFAGSSEARPFRRPHVFGAMCVAFGVGAAIGAVKTVSRAYSLAVPVTLLVIVLLLCELKAANEQRPSWAWRLDLNQASIRAQLTRFVPP